MANPEATDVKHRLTLIRRDAEERDTQRRAKSLGFEYVDLRKVPIAIDALKSVPQEKAHDGKLAAIEVKMHDLAVATFDPKSPEFLAAVEALKEQKYVVKVFVASLSSLEEAWRFYEFVPPPVQQITGKLTIEKERLDSLIKIFQNFPAMQAEFAKQDFMKLTTTQLFEMVIAGSIAVHASDIHLEAQEKVSRIRLRVDGILHDVYSTLPPHNYGNLVARIKLLSGLKINVREEAQDGRYTINLPGKREIEVRVSVIPAEFGETIVMRLLDPESLSVDLGALGLRADDLNFIQKQLNRPNGLILNTGPTGSGKTTTLYAFLKHVSTSEVKVITIEDPIEYRIEGIQQTQVDTEAGYTFADGLRSILRQDPDVILVGEIRDGETADIALQAALTGHLVFSTLHTNDAVGAVPRLIDLKIRPATVGPALSVVIAQRLVRVLCEACRKVVPLSPEQAKQVEQFFTKLPVRVDRAPYKELHVYQPVGCSVCNGFGYKGRRGIFEFLEVNNEMQEVILRSPSQPALRKLAEAQQMVTMQQDGILKALQGVTTFEEVESVTGPLAW